MSDLDKFINDIESETTDISETLTEINNEYGDRIEAYKSLFESYESHWERRNQQDIHIAVKQLQRHFERDYSTIEEAREQEKHIDLLFERANQDPPFEGIGIPRYTDDTEFTGEYIDWDEPKGLLAPLGDKFRQFYNEVFNK